MKKEKTIKIAIVAIMISFLVITSIYALYSYSTHANESISLAQWNVTLNQENVEDSLIVVTAGGGTTYTVNIESTSQVDIGYSIVVSGLPDGVMIALDEGSPETQDNNNTITFTNVGTILHTDAVKTKSHVLTFTADANAEIVSDQTVDIDVLVKQIV